MAGTVRFKQTDARLGDVPQGSHLTTPAKSPCSASLTSLCYGLVQRFCADKVSLAKAQNNRVAPPVFRITNPANNQEVTGVATKTPEGYLVVAHSLPFFKDKPPTAGILERHNIKSLTPHIKDDPVLLLPVGFFHEHGNKVQIKASPGSFIKLMSPKAPPQELTRAQFLKLRFLGGDGVRASPESAVVRGGQSGSVLVNAEGNPLFVLQGFRGTWFSEAVSGVGARINKDVLHVSWKKNIAVYLPTRLQQYQGMYLIEHNRSTGEVHKVHLDGSGYREKLK